MYVPATWNHLTVNIGKIRSCDSDSVATSIGERDWIGLDWMGRKGWDGIGWNGMVMQGSAQHNIGFLPVIIVRRQLTDSDIDD